MKISIPELKDLTKRAILYYGYNEEEAGTILEVLLYAQLRGNNQGVVKLIGKGIPKALDTRPIGVHKETLVSAYLDGGKTHAMVAVKYAATASPTTESLAYGEVVPIPTLPPRKLAA